MSAGYMLPPSPASKTSLVMHPQRLAFSQNPEDEGQGFPVNARNFVADCVASCSRREYRSIQWISGISQHPV